MIWTSYFIHQPLYHPVPVLRRPPEVSVVVVLRQAGLTDRATVQVFQMSVPHSDDPYPGEMAALAGSSP